MKCCEITPGMLRHTITVQRATLATNGSGGRNKTWANQYTARASAVNKTGMERVTADRIDAVRKVQFVIRYTANLYAGDRIIFNGFAHNVRFVDNVEYANRWLKIDCDQGVAT